MSDEVEVSGVRVTKSDKVLVPGAGDAPEVTKLDLARYHQAVADLVLPHLRGRPISMQRFPDGSTGRRSTRSALRAISRNG